jgi:hypothetical protein
MRLVETHVLEIEFPDERWSWCYIDEIGSELT